MKEISMEKAAKYAAKDCGECGGSGWTYSSTKPDDRVEVYCLCVNQRLAEKEEERQDE